MTQSPSGAQPGIDPKAQAKADKAYAKAMRPWYKKKRFVIPLALIVLAIAGGALSGGDDGSSAQDEPSSSAESGGSGEKDTSKGEAKEKKVEVVRATAGDLLKEFEGNELAADTKYKGKRLQVSGVVDKIDTDILDDEKYILRIGTGADFQLTTVNCHDIDTEALSALNQGDDVTVVGDFDDGGDLGVDLKNCELQ